MKMKGSRCAPIYYENKFEDLPEIKKYSLDKIKFKSWIFFWCGIWQQDNIAEIVLVT